MLDDTYINKTQDPPDDLDIDSNSINYKDNCTDVEVTNPGEKKTVAIMKELCKCMQGSHRTVYVNRFYTSLDLLKELHDMDIYTTGTLMKNRIPKELTIPKSTKQFKEMIRGDMIHHLYQYRSKGKMCRAGLVCWKDCDIVYCISNETGTVDGDKCTQRS